MVKLNINLMTKSQEDWTQSSESAYKVLFLSTYSFKFVVCKLIHIYGLNSHTFHWELILLTFH